MVGVGNHDYDFIGQDFHPPYFNNSNDSFGECGIAYSARFCMPPNALCGLGEACNRENNPPLPVFYYRCVCSIKIAVFVVPSNVLT
jgi:hypothetical protein